jgi:hypothetical protein
VGAGVDEAAAADARAVEQPDVLEEGQPLRPEAAQGGHPQVVGQLPVGLGEGFGRPALAALDDEDGVAFLGQPPGGHAAAEAGADDDVIVDAFNREIVVVRGRGMPIAVAPVNCDVHVPLPSG